MTVIEVAEREREREKWRIAVRCLLEGGGVLLVEPYCGEGPHMIPQNAAPYHGRTKNPEIHPQRTNTRRTSLHFHISSVFPAIGSRIHPASVPTFSLNSLNRSTPYMRPLGSTTGSFSTMLFVWCAYGTLRASSLSSVLQMGQTVVVDEEALAEDDVKAEWQAGVLSADRPAERAMWRSGRGGSE